MGKIETGGPAFPCQDNQHYYPGMTLRDHFAAKAMQAYISKSIDRMHDEAHDALWDETDISEMAYSHADAMLEARK